MKHNKMKKVFSFLLVVACMSGLYYIPAEAGASDIIIDSTTYAEELDKSVWNNPDSDIVIQDDAIVFENTSSEFTRLITKTAVKATAEVNELVRAEATMQFTSLPSGQTFAMAFAVKKIESMQGDSGNVELSFTNNGSLCVSAIYYNEDGEAEVLKEATSCASVMGKIDVEAAITTDQMMTVKIGGKTLWTVELPVSGEGRIGFLQTGACGVKLSNVKIVSHLYDSPENCDIYEDFESGGFNANLLTSKMYAASYVCWPSGTGVELYQDNHVLRYTNAGEAYIGTKYTYSNFELSFDVPYLQRQNELNEDGNIVTARSNQFGISYGGEGFNFDYAGYTDAVSDVLWFTGYSTISSMKTKETVDLAALGYPIFAKDCDRGFSVKVVMNDSIVTVYLKWIDEPDYQKVFEYQISTRTPKGYLHLWTAGPTNMAIDNLKIVNKDVNPQLVEVDFKSSIIEGPGDYDYQPMEKEYKPGSVEEGAGGYRVLPIVIVVCVIGLITLIVVSVVKNKKGKAGVIHEKE